MRMRIIPIVMFVGVNLLFLHMLLADQLPQSFYKKEYAPVPNLEITSMDGKKIWQSEALKGQVTIINFFASWCRPCASEMPELLALKQQYPDVVMYGIAWNESPEATQKWLKRNGDPFDVVWRDQTGSASIAMGLKGIPETFIIDKSGRVSKHIVGGITTEMREGELANSMYVLRMKKFHEK